MQQCSYCKRLGATIGCAVETCEKSYHLPCAGKAGAHFDPVRAIGQTGGLFCPQHTFVAEAAGAQPAGAGGTIEPWDRAFSELRAEVSTAADLQAALSGGGSVPDGWSAVVSDASVGSALRDAGGAIVARFHGGSASAAAMVPQRLTQEEIEADRTRLLAYALDGTSHRSTTPGRSSARGSRCSICSGGFSSRLLTEWIPPPASPSHTCPAAPDALKLCAPSQPLLLPRHVATLGRWHRAFSAALATRADDGSAASGHAVGDSGDAVFDEEMWAAVAGLEALPSPQDAPVLDDDGTWWIASAALRCADCSALVHAGCYGVAPSAAERALRGAAATAHGGGASEAAALAAWRCDPCSTARQLVATSSNAPLPVLLPPGPNYACVLCGHGAIVGPHERPPGGAAHALRAATICVVEGANEQAILRISPRSEQYRVWVHASCALWQSGTAQNADVAVSVPDTTTTLVSTPSTIQSDVVILVTASLQIYDSMLDAATTTVSQVQRPVPSQLALRAAHPCAVCGGSEGVTAATASALRSGGVAYYVHASCAVAAQLYVEHCAPMSQSAAAIVAAAALTHGDTASSAKLSRFPHAQHDERKADGSIGLRSPPFPSLDVSIAGGVVAYYSPPPTNGAPLALFCVCREPYDRFMIECEDCHEWYHGDCVGVRNDEMGDESDAYTCATCAALRSEGRRPDPAFVKQNVMKAGAPLDLSLRPRGLRMLVPPASLFPTDDEDDGAEQESEQSDHDSTGGGIVVTAADRKRDSGKRSTARLTAAAAEQLVAEAQLRLDSVGSVETTGFLVPLLFAQLRTWSRYADKLIAAAARAADDVDTGETHRIASASVLRPSAEALLIHLRVHSALYVPFALAMRSAAAATVQYGPNALVLHEALGAPHVRLALSKLTDTTSLGDALLTTQSTTAWCNTLDVARRQLAAIARGGSSKVEWATTGGFGALLALVSAYAALVELVDAGLVAVERHMLAAGMHRIEATTSLDDTALLLQLCAAAETAVNTAPVMPSLALSRRTLALKALILWRGNARQLLVTAAERIAGTHVECTGADAAAVVSALAAATAVGECRDALADIALRYGPLHWMAQDHMPAPSTGNARDALWNAPAIDAHAVGTARPSATTGKKRTRAPLRKLRPSAHVAAPLPVGKAWWGPYAASGARGSVTPATALTYAYPPLPSSPPPLSCADHALGDLRRIKLLAETTTRLLADVARCLPHVKNRRRDAIDDNHAHREAGDNTAASTSARLSDVARLAALLRRCDDLGVSAPMFDTARSLVRDADIWSASAAATLASVDNKDDDGHMLARVRVLLQEGRVLPVRLRLLAAVQDVFERLSWGERADALILQTRRAPTIKDAVVTADAACADVIASIVADVNRVLKQPDQHASTGTAHASVNPDDADVSTVPSRPRLQNVAALLRQAPSASISDDDARLLTLQEMHKACDDVAGANCQGSLSVKDISLSTAALRSGRAALGAFRSIGRTAADITAPTAAGRAAIDSFLRVTGGDSGMVAVQLQLIGARLAALRALPLVVPEEVAAERAIAGTAWAGAILDALRSKPSLATLRHLAAAPLSRSWMRAAGTRITFPVNTEYDESATPGSAEPVVSAGRRFTHDALCSAISLFSGWHAPPDVMGDSDDVPPLTADAVALLAAAAGKAPLSLSPLLGVPMFQSGESSVAAPTNTRTTKQPLSKKRRLAGADQARSARSTEMRGGLISQLAPSTRIMGNVDGDKPAGIGSKSQHSGPVTSIGVPVDKATLHVALNVERNVSLSMEAVAGGHDAPQREIAVSGDTDAGSAGANLQGSVHATSPPLSVRPRRERRANVKYSPSAGMIATSTSADIRKGTYALSAAAATELPKKRARPLEGRPRDAGPPPLTAPIAGAGGMLVAHDAKHTVNNDTTSIPLGNGALSASATEIASAADMPRDASTTTLADLASRKRRFVPPIAVAAAHLLAHTLSCAEAAEALLRRTITAAREIGANRTTNSDIAKNDHERVEATDARSSTEVDSEFAAALESTKNAELWRALLPLDVCETLLVATAQCGVQMTPNALALQRIVHIVRRDADVMRDLLVASPPQVLYRSICFADTDSDAARTEILLFLGDMSTTLRGAFAAVRTHSVASAVHPHGLQLLRALRWCETAVATAAAARAAIFEKVGAVPLHGAVRTLGTSTELESVRASIAQCDAQCGGDWNEIIYAPSSGAGSDGEDAELALPVPWATALSDIRRSVRRLGDVARAVLLICSPPITIPTVVFTAQADAAVTMDDAASIVATITTLAKAASDVVASRVTLVDEARRVLTTLDPAMISQSSAPATSSFSAAVASVAAGLSTCIAGADAWDAEIDADTGTSTSLNVAEQTKHLAAADGLRVQPRTLRTVVLRVAAAHAALHLHTLVRVLQSSNGAATGVPVAQRIGMTELEAISDSAAELKSHCDTISEFSINVNLASALDGLNKLLVTARAWRATAQKLLLAGTVDASAVVDPAREDPVLAARRLLSAPHVFTIAFDEAPLLREAVRAMEQWEGDARECMAAATVPLLSALTMLTEPLTRAGAGAGLSSCADNGDRAPADALYERLRAGLAAVAERLAALVATAPLSSVAEVIGSSNVNRGSRGDATAVTLASALHLTPLGADSAWYRRATTAGTTPLAFIPQRTVLSALSLALQRCDAVLHIRWAVGACPSGADAIREGDSGTMAGTMDEGERVWYNLRVPPRLSNMRAAVDTCTSSLLALSAWAAAAAAAPDDVPLLASAVVPSTGGDPPAPLFVTASSIVRRSMTWGTRASNVLSGSDEPPTPVLSTLLASATSSSGTGSAEQSLLLAAAAPDEIDYVESQLALSELRAGGDGPWAYRQSSIDDRATDDVPAPRGEPEAVTRAVAARRRRLKWAKYRGFPFWPAQLVPVSTAPASIAVQADAAAAAGKVLVQFYGAHPGLTNAASQTDSASSLFAWVKRSLVRPWGRGADSDDCPNVHPLGGGEGAYAVAVASATAELARAAAASRVEMSRGGLSVLGSTAVSTTIPANTMITVPVVAPSTPPEVASVVSANPDTVASTNVPPPVVSAAQRLRELLRWKQQQRATTGAAGANIESAHMRGNVVSHDVAALDTPLSAPAAIMALSAEAPSAAAADNATSSPSDASMPTATSVLLGSSTSARDIARAAGDVVHPDPVSVHPVPAVPVSHDDATIRRRTTEMLATALGVGLPTSTPRGRTLVNSAAAALEACLSGRFPLRTRKSEYARALRALLPALRAPAAVATRVRIVTGALRAFAVVRWGATDWERETQLAIRGHAVPVPSTDVARTAGRIDTDALTPLSTVQPHAPIVAVVGKRPRDGDTAKSVESSNPAVPPASTVQPTTTVVSSTNRAAEIAFERAFEAQQLALAAAEADGRAAAVPMPVEPDLIPGAKRLRSGIDTTSETPHAAAVPASVPVPALMPTARPKPPAVHVVVTSREHTPAHCSARRVEGQDGSNRAPQQPRPPSFASGAQLTISGRMTVDKFIEHVRSVHDKSTSRALCLFHLMQPADTAGRAAFDALMRYLGRDNRVGVVHEDGKDDYVYVIPPPAALAMPDALAVRRARGRFGPAALLASHYSYGTPEDPAADGGSVGAFLLLEYKPPSYRHWETQEQDRKLGAGAQVPISSAAVQQLVTPESTSTSAILSTTPDMSVRAPVLPVTQLPAVGVSAPHVHTSGAETLVPDAEHINLMRATAAMCADAASSGSTPAAAVALLASQSSLGPEFAFVRPDSHLFPLFMAMIAAASAASGATTTNISVPASAPSVTTALPAVPGVLAVTQVDRSVPRISEETTAPLSFSPHRPLMVTSAPSAVPAPSTAVTFRGQPVSTHTQNAMQPPAPRPMPAVSQPPPKPITIMAAPVRSAEPTLSHAATLSGAAAAPTFPEQATLHPLPRESHGRQPSHPLAIVTEAAAKPIFSGSGSINGVGSAPPATAALSAPTGTSVLIAASGQPAVPVRPVVAAGSGGWGRLGAVATVPANTMPTTHATQATVVAPSAPAPAPSAAVKAGGWGALAKTNAKPGAGT